MIHDTRPRCDIVGDQDQKTKCEGHKGVCTHAHTQTQTDTHKNTHTPQTLITTEQLHERATNRGKLSGEGGRGSERQGARRDSGTASGARQPRTAFLFLFSKTSTLTLYR